MSNMDQLKMGHHQIDAKNRFLGLFSGAFYGIAVTKAEGIEVWQYSSLATLLLGGAAGTGVIFLRKWLGASDN